MTGRESDLPSTARARMAEIRQAGPGARRCPQDEFAAIRSVGFEPVGQVLGAAVYNIGFTGGYNCPGAWSGYGPYAVAYRGRSPRCPGSGGYGSFGPLTQAMYEARHQAIDRMLAECAALGGHGIVGVSLTIGSFPAGGLEFKAIGTAVRAPGAPPLPQPFSSDLSGQDFAKLIQCRLGAGRAGARHLGRRPARRLADRGPDPLGCGQRRGHRVHRAGQRQPARRPAAAGDRTCAGWAATACVVSRMDMRVHERECPMQEHGKDHVVEVTIVGTAMVRFAPRRSRRRRSPSCRSTRSAARRPGSGWDAEPAAVRHEEMTMTDQQSPQLGAAGGAGLGDAAGTELSAEGVPQDAMRRLAELRPGPPGLDLHLRPVGQRVPAGPRGRVPPAGPGAGQLDLPRRAAGRPLGQEPGTRRAVPGHVPRP